MSENSRPCMKSSVSRRHCRRGRKELDSLNYNYTIASILDIKVTLYWRLLYAGFEFYRANFSKAD